MRLLHLLSGSCLIALSLAAAAPSRAAPVTLDSGTFIVYQNDKPVGTEAFTAERRGDSLIVTSRADLTHSMGGSDVKVEKSLLLLLSAFDFGLHHYESKQLAGDNKLSRAINVHDTTIALYRENEVGGTAAVLSLPPGRLFVIDPMMFALFDVMCLSLHEHVFTTRPISLLSLAATDSLFEAQVEDLGTETIRWGAKPVKARKLKFADQTVSFLAWTGPSGGLLRLEQPEQKLRVERQPAPVKKRERREPPETPEPKPESEPRGG
jgi:hypothetical protein